MSLSAIITALGDKHTKERLAAVNKLENHLQKTIVVDVRRSML